MGYVWFGEILLAVGLVGAGWWQLRALRRSESSRLLDVIAPIVEPTNVVPRRFLALGDSYTIGEGVLPSERWVTRLAARARSAGLTLGEPQIIATTGWTTDELAAGIAAAAPAGSYALVTLLIGVNNQYRGRSLGEYVAHLEALLEQAIGFAGGVAGRVVMLSIPDWGVTTFAAGRDRVAIATEIDAFNAAAAALARARGVSWVDITPISRQRPDGWEAADGLHPSGAQYAQWAEAAFETVRSALQR